MCYFIGRVKYKTCLSSFTLFCLTHIPFMDLQFWCLDLQYIYNINSHKTERKQLNQNYVSKPLTGSVYIFIPFSHRVALYPLSNAFSPVFTASSGSASCQVDALLARTQKTDWMDSSHFWGVSVTHHHWYKTLVKSVSHDMRPLSLFHQQTDKHKRM